MKNKFIYILFLLTSPLLLISQQSANKPFDEVVRAIDENFEKSGALSGNEKLQKRYARWFKYNSTRLGKDHQLIDHGKALQKAWKQESQKNLQRTTTGTWTFLGPDQSSYGNVNAVGNGLGRIDRVAFHPSNANIIFAGTAGGGLWKTTNGGTTWNCLTDGLPVIAISGIVIDHSNPDNIYILTGDGDSNFAALSPSIGFVEFFGYMQASMGVYKSVDGGDTWQQTGFISDETYQGYRLIQHPTNANILFAATTVGLFKTSSGGTFWTEVQDGWFFDVAFKPGTPSTVYATGVGSFIYSTDTGSSWQTDSNFDVNLCSDRVEIAVTPAASNYVYLLSGPATGTGTFCGIFRSTDSGQNFTRRSNSPNILGSEADGSDNSDASLYDLAIAVKPTSSLRLFTGGFTIWTSTSGGTNLTSATPYFEDGSSKYVHPDIHDLAYNPLDNKLFAATDGGLYVSSNDGSTWTNISNGINVSQIFHFDGRQSSTNTLLVGFQDNGVKYRNSNTSDLGHVDSGDGYDAALWNSNSNKGYMTVNKNVYSYSDIQAGTRVNLTDVSSSTGGLWFPSIDIDYEDPDTVYVGYANVFKYASDDSYVEDLGAAGYWDVQTSASSPNMIYAAGGNSWNSLTGNVFASLNKGKDWLTISNNTGFPATYPVITDIAVRPNVGTHVCVAFSGYDPVNKVLQSFSQGGAWSNITYNLPNVPVRCLAITTNNDIYAGTDLGVYYKPVGINEWFPFSNGLPMVPISDIYLYNTQNKIVVSTFGRGMWKSDTYSNCPVSKLVSNIPPGFSYHEASQSISSSDEVLQSVGTQVTFNAGNYVRMDPGFKMEAGNKFIVYLGGCGVLWDGE